MTVTPTSSLASQTTSLFASGRLDLSARPDAPIPGWGALPEAVYYAERLRAEGASPAAIRFYVTLTAAMDRARDADRLWRLSADLFLRVPWLYSPDALDRAGEAASLLRQGGVSQRHSVDVPGWLTILRSVHEGRETESEAARAIYDGQADAGRLLRQLQSMRPDGTPAFPLLRGPKIGPMWVRMLAFPGGAIITGLEVLPVSVDVQVRKLTEYIGLTETTGHDLENVRASIQDAWRRQIAEGGAVGPPGLEDTAAALDPALWFYARWGCTHCERVGRRVSISEVCSRCRFDEIHGRDRRVTPPVPTSRAEVSPAIVKVIRPPGETLSKQRLPYFVGVSGESAGATSLSMNLVVIPTGGAAQPHVHRGYETAIYLVRGRVDTRYGPGLRESVICDAGDFIFIGPDVPHQPVNLSDSEAAIAVVARNDPKEQESVAHYDPASE